MRLFAKNFKRGMRANMNNAEILKELADRNCSNCKHRQTFKSNEKMFCTNAKSPIVNKETYGNMWCDEFEKGDAAK